MAATDRPIWFVGDRADPAAAAIARRLPVDRTRLVTARGALPRFRLGDSVARPGVVVVHRATLGQTDLDRLARLRGWLGEAGRVVLCVGPHARAVEVERWLGVVDAVVPDALAAATIARHVGPSGRGASVMASAPTTGPGEGHPGVVVVSTNHELRATLTALLRAHRFAVAERSELEEMPGSTPPADPAVTVWDVPALEVDWPDRLRAATAIRRAGPVVALIGFLDARAARTAREAGAALALDLPVDVADLVEAVRHAPRGRRDQAHAVPPPPRPTRRTPTARRRGAD